MLKFVIRTPKSNMGFLFDDVEDAMHFIYVMNKQFEDNFSLRGYINKEEDNER